MIRSIVSQSNRPSFNLATEEYLLRSSDENIQFFYINSPSVIIGKHQNALAEINLNFLEENKIPLYRRQSGGGTVYHDFGNINFCFIQKGVQGDLVNFKRATEPIVQALNQWDIPARNGERNDLLLNFKKISGNACHVYKRRVMHHGTLLFDSNLNMLVTSLKNDPTKFKDRAVKSVRSEVINIKEFYHKRCKPEEFMNDLVNSIVQNNNQIATSTLKENEIEEIFKLEKEKYLTHEWNYNYGPSYEFRKRSVLEKHVYNVQMKVEKGKILDLSIKTNNPNKEIIEEIIQKINGVHHQKRNIEEKLSALHTPDHLLQLSEIFF